MRKFTGYIWILLLPVLFSCGEKSRLKMQLSRQIAADPRAWEQIISLQGTLVNLGNPEANLLQDYCLQFTSVAS